MGFKEALIFPAMGWHRHACTAIGERLTCGCISVFRSGHYPAKGWRPTIVNVPSQKTGTIGVFSGVFWDNL
jgi:hypothetical protein